MYKLVLKINVKVSRSKFMNCFILDVCGVTLSLYPHRAS